MKPAKWTYTKKYEFLTRGTHFEHFLSHNEMVSLAECAFQEEGGTNTLHLTMRDDGDPIAQDIRLVHVVSREHNRAV